MFENRVRKRKRNTLLLIIALILVSAFSFGYYLNYDSDENVNKINTNQGSAAGYKIPSSIRNPGNTDIIANADTGEDAEQEKKPTAATYNLITPNTKIIFKTYFTLCGHMFDKGPDDTKDLVNLSKTELEKKFTDWTINEFSTQQVILKREIQTYCPRHYIIGSKDGYIAIFKYNDDGVKILYEMTENPISVLTREDQQSLEYGIVADSEEELQQKLEGLGD